MKFRPHHFLCTVGFEGKGYSDSFVRAYQALADELRGPGGDDVVIEVVANTDEICDACPNRRGELCETEAKIRKLDHGHAAVLGLKPGDRLTWGEAKRLLAEKMTLDAFESACAPCGWKSHGICRAALTKLRKDHGKLGALVAIFLVAGLAGFFPAPASAKAHSKSHPKSHVKNAKAAKKKKVVEEPPPDAPAPVDELRTRLLGDKKTKASSRARSVKKAYDALEARKYALAMKLASGFEKDELFGDYGSWIFSRAALGEADGMVSHHKSAEASGLASRAVSAMQRVELRFPSSPFLKKEAEILAHADLISAEADFSKKKFKASRELFERAFQRATAHELLAMLGPDDLQHYAHLCMKLGMKLGMKSGVKSGVKKPDDVCTFWLHRFASMYPRDSLEIKALAKESKDAAERAKPARAIGKLIQAYRAPDLDQEAFDDAMDLYDQGEYGKAIDAFQKFLDEFPKSSQRYRAEFWLGQAYGHQQKHEKADAVYEALIREAPLGYYGLAAAMSAGKDVSTYLGAGIPTGVATEDALSPSERLRLERIESLVSVGAGKAAFYDFRAFRARPVHSNEFLTYLAMLGRQAGDYAPEFGVLTDLILRGYEPIHSEYGIELAFPVAYRDLIAKYSEQNHVDPILVLSLIKQESAFDPDALSGAGALGLMQLMPSTGIDVRSDIEVRQLADPETSIAVGTKYLAFLLKRFNGNVVLALASYNAGPGAVDRWWRAAKERKHPPGMLEFIESIPYRETREYVSSIVRNYFWYARKLKGETLKSLSCFWSLPAPGGGQGPKPSSE